MGVGGGWSREGEVEAMEEGEERALSPRDGCIELQPLYPSKTREK